MAQLTQNLKKFPCLSFLSAELTAMCSGRPGWWILLLLCTWGMNDEETDLAPSHMAAATGDMPTYQIRAPTTALPQGVVMAASPGSLHSPQQLAEEATRKRELRLMKNREAARECRRKKKEYVKCLENRVAVLENQNKTLIEELKALKDLYCHKAE